MVSCILKCVAGYQLLCAYCGLVVLSSARWRIPFTGVAPQMPSRGVAGADGQVSGSGALLYTPAATAPITTFMLVRAVQAARSRRIGVPGCGCYNDSMTTTSSLVPPALLGLTAIEATRIQTAIDAALAPTTKTVYAYAWHRWQTWAVDRGVPALPADPVAVCAYLTERAAGGASAATIDSACSSIGHEHRRRALPDPLSHTGLQQVRRGLRRTLGAGPRRLARPLDVSDILAMVNAIDRTTAKGVRDAAIILFGFASALRRSELAALTLADIETKPSGLLVHVRQSKTDTEARGEVVGVAHGRHAVTDPIAALGGWLPLRGSAAGPLFTSMRYTHRTGATTLDPLSGDAISRMLRERARVAGLPAERVTGHSLRAGHATAAALAGVSIDRIAAQTRHKRVAVLIERYIRPVDALEHSSSRDLGL